MTDLKSGLATAAGKCNSEDVEFMGLADGVAIVVFVAITNKSNCGVSFYYNDQTTIIHVPEGQSRVFTAKGTRSRNKVLWKGGTKGSKSKNTKTLQFNWKVVGVTS